jgi:DNA-binding Xre family transcriptional regulator
MRSFNENLVTEFEGAKRDRKVDVNELHREVAIANAAINSMVKGRVANLEERIAPATPKS